MNKEVLEVALAMMAQSEHFTMAQINVWHDNTGCSTPGCIAGHIVEAAAQMKEAGMLAPEMHMYECDSESEFAARVAGIGDHDCGELFAPAANHPGCSFSYTANEGERGYITREHAVACLREYIDTGIVDWAGTAPKGGSDENC